MEDYGEEKHGHVGSGQRMGPDSERREIRTNRTVGQISLTVHSNDLTSVLAAGIE